MDFTELTEEDVPGAKLTKDPKDCTVLELKRWLACHGLKQVGRKNELIERVTNSIGLLVKVDPKIDQGIWYEKKNDIRKTQDVMCIDSANKTYIWKDFPSNNIPAMFNYGHIYHYLIESISSDSIDESNEYDAVTAKPLKKGRSLMTSGFVEDVQDTVTEDGYYLIRAHVHHSMKNLLPLHVRINISGVSGSIKEAQCSCKASSLGRCAHIAALLFFLDEHIKNMGHQPILSSTSKPCSWGKGKKRQKNPRPVQSATYKSSKKDASNVSTFDPRPNECRLVNQELKNKFIADMESEGSSTQETSMWLTLLKINYEDFILDNGEVELYQVLRERYVASIKETLNEISSSEHTFQFPDTVSQRESLSWNQERSCRITASISKKITLLGENSDRLNNFNWLKHQYWFKKNIITRDMRYGIEEEENAIEKFSLFSGLKVEKSGLWVNKKYVHLGSSPDGLIFNENKLDCIVEIKCIKSLRTQTVDQWMNNGVESYACVKREENTLILKKSHPYYFQVQLQLLITEASLCYFVLHSKVGDPYIIRITRDETLQKRIIEGTYRFWYHTFIPEYFLMRVPRGLLPYDIDN